MNSWGYCCDEGVTSDYDGVCACLDGVEEDVSGACECIYGTRNSNGVCCPEYASLDEYNSC
jgi:hypothetical protein